MIKSYCKDIRNKSKWYPWVNFKIKIIMYCDSGVSPKSPNSTNSYEFKATSKPCKMLTINLIIDTNAQTDIFKNCFKIKR